MKFSAFRLRCAPSSAVNIGRRQLHVCLEVQTARRFMCREGYCSIDHGSVTVCALTLKSMPSVAMGCATSYLVPLYSFTFINILPFQQECNGMGESCVMQEEDKEERSRACAFCAVIIDWALVHNTCNFLLPGTTCMIMAPPPSRLQC